MTYCATLCFFSAGLPLFWFCYWSSGLLYSALPLCLFSGLCCLVKTLDSFWLCVRLIHFCIWTLHPHSMPEPCFFFYRSFAWQSGSSVWTAICHCLPRSTPGRTWAKPPADVFHHRGCAPHKEGTQTMPKHVSNAAVSTNPMWFPNAFC